MIVARPRPANLDVKGDDLVRPARPTPTKPLIGGRWAVSVPGWVLLLPLAGFVTFVSEHDVFSSAASVARWSGIVVISWLCVGAVLGAADRTVLRNRRVRAVPTAVVVAVGAAAGVGRTVGVLTGRGLFGIADPGPLTLRFAVGAVLGACAVPAAAALLSRRDQLRRHYARTLEAEVAAHRSAQLSEAERQRVRHLLASAVGEHLTAGQAGKVGEVKPSPEELSALAGRARALSHALWQAETSMPKTSGWLLLGRTVLDAAIRPAAPAAALAVIGLAVWVPAVGGQQATILVGAAVAGVVVCVELANTDAVRGQPPRRRLMLIVGLLSCAPLPAAVLTHHVGAPAAGAVPSLLFMWVFTVLLVPFAAVDASPTVRSRIAGDALARNVMADELRTLALNAEYAAAARQVAAQVHGTLQADLFAAAAQLSAGRTCDAASKWLTYQTPDEFAAALLADNPAEGTLGGELAALTAQWGDLLATETQWRDAAPADVALTPTARHRLRVVLTEVLHDAARHGHATGAAVTVDGADGVAAVAVHDNGTGLPHPVTRGLGSDLLDTHTLQWSRQRHPAGGTLTIVLLPT